MATSAKGWQVAGVDEIPPVKDDWPATWKSVRHHFGITGFGVNAVTKGAGEELIPEHDETLSGQQELYFVHAGAVKATLDGEDVALPDRIVPPLRARCHAAARVDRIADDAARDGRHPGQGVRASRLGGIARP